ncbi:hypothetical protein ACFX13_035642 [Malus domestica]
MKQCQEEQLMGHLGVVLYKHLGEEYPEVFGSILGALKAIVNVIGMTKLTPPIKDLLPRQVWATFPEINPTDTSNVVSLLEWLHSLDCNDNQNLSKLSLALLICSQIWKERNQVVFRNGKAIPGRVVMLAMSLGKDFMNANESNKETSKSHRFIRWNPPRRGFLKINFDGSVVNSKATAGFVIRNEDGDPIAVVQVLG